MSQSNGVPEQEPGVNEGLPDTRGKKITPWAWVGSVNFAQGLQYVVATQLFSIVFKTMGVDNGTILFWVSFLVLPWTIKPLWGPLVDKYWTKRNWTIWMQLLVGISFLGVAAALQIPDSFLHDLAPKGISWFFWISLVFLFALAFAAATHDIACDGYYMLTLTQKQQAFFVSIRSTFFRLAMIFANSVLILIPAWIQDATSPEPSYLRAVVEVTETEVVVPPAGATFPVKGEAAQGSSWTATTTAPWIKIATAAGEGAATTDITVEANEKEPREAIVTVGTKSFLVRQARQKWFDSITGFFSTPQVTFTEPKPMEKLEPLPVAESIFKATPSELQLKRDTSTTITLALTKAPENPEGLIVLSRNLGDSGISLKAVDPAFAERITFTDKNWKDGVVMTVAADKKIGESTHADFKFTAGDIPLSWTMMALSCGVLFLLFFFYHQFAMPMPAADATGSGSKVPLYVPLFALAATLLVPIGLGYGLYYLLSKLYLPVGSMIYGNGEVITDMAKVLTPLQLKGYNFFFTASILLVVVAVGSLFLILPFLKKPAASFFFKMSDMSGIGFADVFVTFFQKERILLILSFILTFRLGEVQLSQIKNIFFIDSLEKGGLGLSLTEFAITNSVVYVVALIVGGILSGTLIAKYGLKKILWPLIAALHLPNALFIYLAYAQPHDYLTINICVAAESFGYGLGLTAYLLIMIMAAQGPYKTAHYALCTGFMSLGVMIPGMWTGFLQELIGYEWFFIVVLISVIPGTIITAFVPIDPEFGKKAK